MAARSIRELGPGRYYGPGSETRSLHDWQHVERWPQSTPWQEIADGVWERRCCACIIQARRGPGGRWWGYTPWFTYGGRTGYPSEHTAKATATREAHVRDAPKSYWMPGPCG